MLEHLLLHPYAFIIPLSILEGPLLAVACGVGAALGYINPFAAWVILVIGDLLPDLVYWSLGHWGARLPWVRRVATRIRLLREHLPPLEHLWRTRLFATLTAAKLAWGVSPAFIVSAGLGGVRAWRFVTTSLLISIPYLGILMGIGYGLTFVYGELGFSRLDAEVLISVMGFVFFSILLWSIRYARRRLDPRRARRQSNVILPDASR